VIKLNGHFNKAALAPVASSDLMSALWSSLGFVDTLIWGNNNPGRCDMTRRKRYSAEFKREAIRRANEEGVTDVLVAEELEINARQLRRWRNAIKRDGEKAFPGEGNAKDQELMLLKRKLAKVEQERDFLKEAAAYFAKESK
jgi:transposase